MRKWKHCSTSFLIIVTYQRLNKTTNSRCLYTYNWSSRYKKSNIIKRTILQCAWNVKDSSYSWNACKLRHFWRYLFNCFFAIISRSIISIIKFVALSQNIVVDKTSTNDAKKNEIAIKSIQTMTKRMRLQSRAYRQWQEKWDCNQEHTDDDKKNEAATKSID